MRGRLPAARVVCGATCHEAELTLQYDSNGRRSCQRVHDDSHIALPALPDWLFGFELLGMFSLPLCEVLQGLAQAIDRR